MLVTWCLPKLPPNKQTESRCSENRLQNAPLLLRGVDILLLLVKGLFSLFSFDLRLSRPPPQPFNCPGFCFSGLVGLEHISIDKLLLLVLFPNVHLSDGAHCVWPWF